MKKYVVHLLILYEFLIYGLQEISEQLSQNIAKNPLLESFCWIWTQAGRHYAGWVFGRRQVCIVCVFGRCA